MTSDSTDDPKRALKRLLQVRDVLKQQAQQSGETFHCRGDEELIEKSRGAIPYFMAFSANDFPTAGQTYRYSVTVVNPTQTELSWCFVGMFFGGFGLLDDNRYLEACAAAAINTEPEPWWPYRSNLLNVLPPGWTQLRDDFTVPREVPVTTYFGNLVLWGQRMFNPYVYYDRLHFPMVVQAPRDNR